MTIHILQWGLFSFMIGLLLSLPLAAVHYQGSPGWTQLFTNPRKLKSAHLDFFTQAFAAGLAYVLEQTLRTPFPDYVVIPLLYGTICNPLILLLEATPLYRSGTGRLLYFLLRGTSPAALLFAWFFIAWRFLPMQLMVALPVIAVLGALVIWSYTRRRRG